MAARRTALPFLVLFLGLSQASAQERDLLYFRSLSGKLNDVVGAIRDPGSKKVPYEQLTVGTDYFVRIAPRKHLLTDQNNVQDGAILGTKPFVFVTTPESLHGRSLLEIYEDIGYEAEDIIRLQRNEDMVAVVFRYPDSITISDVRNGRTVEPGKQGEFAPERLFFRSEAERAFILGYPEEGKCRIKKTRYAALCANGGSDWVYRKLLEAKLSIFEHFQGNGRTHNGVLDPDDLQSEAGLLEFVGPNRKIKDLPEVAVIHLGRLVIESRFGAGPPGDLPLAAAERPNGYSGIAVVAEGTYLVVKDYKVPLASDPRIRTLSASPDEGAVYRPIASG